MAWEEYPQVALDFMNRDHAEFATLCARLLSELDGAASTECVTGLLEELHGHTRNHFAAEEEAMLQSGFPPYPIHKGEHERVLSGFAAKADDWNRTHDVASLREWLERDVGDWFVNHIRTMDFVTAEFVNRTRTTSPSR